MLKDGIARFMHMHGLGEVKRDASLIELTELLQKHTTTTIEQGLPFHSTRHKAMAALIELHNQLHPDKLLSTRLTGHFDKPIHHSDRARRFYLSASWLVLRFATLARYGRKCMACGETKGPMHVDHIKSLRRHWHLRLNPDNMQVLCGPCNLGKGNELETDFRPRSMIRLRGTAQRCAIFTKSD